MALCRPPLVNDAPSPRQNCSPLSSPNRNRSLLASTRRRWNKYPNSRVVAAALGGYHGESQVIGKQYFVRQAAILFKFAKATKDPKVSAALLDQAADLKQQVDEPGAQQELSPLAPDIEPPPAT